MGAPIGFFSDDAPNDYPELNKCPDCETYFQALYCPLCGKECPEEMRAGNRKPVKQKKSRGPRGGGRTRFVPWYFQTWFIVVMLFVMPIVGLILLWQSDHGRGAKIGLSLLVVAPTLLSWLAAMLLNLLPFGGNGPEVPEYERDSYVAACETVDVEALWRNPDSYEGKNVELSLTVLDKHINAYAQTGDYETFYECVATVDGKELRFLIADVRLDESTNLATGDRIRLWGAVLGNTEIFSDLDGKIVYPAAVMYFSELVE